MTFFKRKAARAPEYLAFVRTLECCNCQAPPPSQASHLGPKGNSGGMGLKAPDWFASPLCSSCHERFHRIGALPIVSPECVDLDEYSPQESRARHVEGNRDALAKYVESLEAL